MLRHKGCLLLCLALVMGCSADDPPPVANRCGAACTSCVDEAVGFPPEVPHVVRLLGDNTHFYLQTESEDSSGHTYSAYEVPRVGGSSVRLHSLFENHTDAIEAPPAGFDLAFSSLYIYGSGDYRIPLDGSEAIRLRSLATPSAVFLADSIVSLIGTSYVAQPEIARLAPDGERQEALYRPTGSVLSIAYGGDHLFWEQLAEDQLSIGLYRGALDGRPAELIATGLSTFGGYRENSIAADNKFVYYFRDIGDLYRANHDGSEPVRLTNGLSSVHALGDGCSLVTVGSGLEQGTYFASDEGGPLVRVSKRVGSPWADATHVYVAAREGVFRTAR